jgi:hydroxymethylpyrimidine pyrophosphatase-like HAD family hydrolase
MNTIISARPTAVGYVSAVTPDAEQQQRALLANYASREGLSLAHTVDDPRDGVTLSELLDVADRYEAVRVLVAAGVRMAARHRSVTDVLERIGAACTVVTPDGVEAAGWMIALDIDGTLTAEGAHDVPADTVVAVTEARAAGHDVVLASGRSLVGILPIARVLGMTTGWVTASNGAVTARLVPDAPRGYTVEEQHTLDVEPVARLALDLIPDLRIGVEDIGWGYLHLRGRRFDDRQVNGRQRGVDVEELWAVESPRVILHAPGAAVRLLEPVRALGVTATVARPDWIDVTPMNLSKASALEVLRTRLDVAPERTVAVGDGTNDAEMLTWAARGVAMGHASAELRAVADETTGTLEEHGAATVLRSLAAAIPATR